MTQDDKNYLSQEKYDELTKELEYLKTESRKEVARKLEYAKSLGDLSENTEYQEAREAQANIEERIATVENLLKSSVIVAEHRSDTIDIGTSVTMTKGERGEEELFHVVGSEEADVSAGKISNKSPLGESLMGKKAGDSFVFKAPNGEVRGKIIKIE